MSGRAADGKQALFSAAVRTPGTLVLECETCGARSRVGYVELARRSLPLPLWFPWRRHARLARCPACERRTWLAEHWRA
ncbi:MAG: hypothetical protein ACXVJ7_18750 [Acidimicrobiia bacterium]